MMEILRGALDLPHALRILLTRVLNAVHGHADLVHPRHLLLARGGDLRHYVRGCGNVPGQGCLYSNAKQWLWAC